MNGNGYFLKNIGGSLGLGYAIAIALGFLVLLSTILLASYICCRRRRRRLLSASPLPTAVSSSVNPDRNAVILPRIFFVAEDESPDDRVVVGLDQAVISSYPKFPFSAAKDPGGAGGGGDSVCSICLCDYRDGEMLRMLPDCRHFFHISCIDAWLRLNASCPVCRTSPLPTPVSTPLSELVPLSHFPSGGGRR